MNNCTFLRDNCISVNDKMPRPVLRIDADTISSDIEEAARGYYERLFNREPYHFLSVGEMLMILKRFRNSAIERERVIL